MKAQNSPMRAIMMINVIEAARHPTGPWLGPLPALNPGKELNT